MKTNQPTASINLGSAPRRKDVGGRPFVLGHRGAMAVAPENSEAGFLRALKDGADGVELDVRLSADGEVVVFHDADLFRLAGRRDRVIDLPWPQLEETVLFSGARVRRLADVLPLFPHGTMVNVEIKTDGLSHEQLQALVDASAHTLEPWVDNLRVLVSSFDARTLPAWSGSAPGMPFGLLYEEQLPSVLPQAAALHPHHILCTPARVVAWRTLGYAVNVWTVDDPQRACALAAMGVDVIISNNPGVILAALQS